jgi:hypothetical protein
MYEFVNLDLLKAENPEAYKKLAEKGIMVGHPVTIGGQDKRGDIGIHYHTTVKFFNPEKDAPEAIHNVAKQLNFIPPDSKKTRIEPGVFKDRLGNDVYVIKLHGEHADQIKGHNKKFDHMGYPSTYEFHPHISVEKAMWEKIVASKAQTAHEAGIEFGPAQLRQGSEVLATYKHNPIAQPEATPAAPKEPEKLAASEEMQKGIKEWGTAASLATAVAGMTPTQIANPAIPQGNPATVEQAKPQSTYSREKMLQAISSVESSGGKFANHRMLGGIHEGESAFGKYGLTPMVIRETVNMHRDLKSKHSKIVGLKGSDLHHYMQDNPGLEDEIAQRHLARLEHHFGQNPAEIGHAWLQGIRGTHKAKKENQDIHDHWHVKKIKTAYGT